MKSFRALEWHNVAKHQVAFVALLLRNVYHEDVLAQMLRYAAATSTVTDGCERVGDIL